MKLLYILLIAVLFLSCNRAIPPPGGNIPVDGNPMSGLGIRYIDSLQTQLVCGDCQYLDLIPQNNGIKEIYIFDVNCRFPAIIKKGALRELEVFVSYGEIDISPSIFSEATKLKLFSMPNHRLINLPTSTLSEIYLTKVFANLKTVNDLGEQIGNIDSIKSLSIVTRDVRQEIQSLDDFVSLSKLSLLTNRQYIEIKVPQLNKLEYLSQLSVDADLNNCLDVIARCQNLEYLRVKRISDLSTCLPVLRNLSNLKGIAVDRLSVENRVILNDVVPLVEYPRWPEIE